MRKSGAYRHIEEDVGSSESKEVYRTGIMASLQERDRQRERKLATTRKKSTMKVQGTAFVLHYHERAPEWLWRRPFGP